MSRANSAMHKRSAIWRLRTQALAALLQMGTHVLLCDVDAVLLRNPWPYLSINIPEQENSVGLQSSVSNRSTSVQKQKFDILASHAPGSPPDIKQKVGPLSAAPSEMPMSCSYAATELVS